jgi:hypothetical protein
VEKLKALAQRLIVTLSVAKGLVFARNQKILRFTGFVVSYELTRLDHATVEIM